MRLMRIPESIEASCLYLHDAGPDLLIAEGMAATQLVFVFAYAIDKNRLAVQ